MFVWRNSDLPPDPEYPADLKKLGYFINENDRIRQIANPEEDFKYRINRNERFNIKQREAMNEIIRDLVMQRLLEAGLQTMRLPFRDTQPRRESHPNEAHVPILVSPNLHGARRIIVVFGESTQDLGVWAYRSIANGINIGSAVNFVKAVRGDGNWETTTDDMGTRTDTALVLANTGQLLWHCARARAVTQTTWLANPRPAGNWGQASTSYRNEIPGHANWQEHVSYVLEQVIRPNLHAWSRVDMIGMAEGALGVIIHMMRRWNAWRPYISGIVLGDPLHTTAVELDMSSLADRESFTAFVSSRCIAYVLSPDELGTLQSGYRSHGCNCYSSGEPLNSECILPSAWPHMLSWLDKVHRDPGYAEQVVIMGTDMDDEMRQAMEGLKMPEDGNLPADNDEDSQVVAKEEFKVGYPMEGGKNLSNEAVKQEIERDIKAAVREDAKPSEVKLEEDAGVKMEDVEEEKGGTKMQEEDAEGPGDKKRGSLGSD